MSEEWPAESTNRSRPTQCESAGSWRMTFWKSRYAAGASEIAVPGWPLPTFSTASAARALMVLTAWSSRGDHSRGWLAGTNTFTGPLSRPESAPRIIVDTTRINR